MITLRFCDGNSFVTAAIQRAEYGFWASHVEALTPDGTLLGAHIDGGVQARSRDYDKGQFTRELFIKIDANARVLRSISRVPARAARQAIRYDRNPWFRRRS